MPCYDPPRPHEERREEFLVAALCYATAKLTSEQLSGFPGLLEWRKRHAHIDAQPENKKWTAAYEYDRQNDPDDATPKYMSEFMAAVPAKAA